MIQSILSSISLASGHLTHWKQRDSMILFFLLFVFSLGNIKNTEDNRHSIILFTIQWISEGEAHLCSKVSGQQQDAAARWRHNEHRLAHQTNDISYWCIDEDAKQSRSTQAGPISVVRRNKTRISEISSILTPIVY